MTPMDDKACYNHGGSAQENAGTNNFDFQNGQKPRRQQHQKVLGSRAKATPSKWDDAQKWLVNLSAAAAGRDLGHGKGGGGGGGKPRNSNADDRRLLHSLSQRGRDSCSSADGGLNDEVVLPVPGHEEGEMKRIDYGGVESLWRTSKPMEDPAMVVRSVCLRDMGTEMTPIASKEPSRTGTPLRATTPVLRSPISSRTSTPGRSRQDGRQNEATATHQAGIRNFERRSDATIVLSQNSEAAATTDGGKKAAAMAEVNGPAQGSSPDPLEARAMAWDEAERAKYMARYKREEVKIQAWENQEKRRAEMELKRMEIKAERLKARAQEKLTNKLAATRRIAEEKRANAEAKLTERAARTSEKAEYIRRTGRVPSSCLSFKMPYICG